MSIIRTYLLTYSVGTDGPGELGCDSQMVKFPIWIPVCDSHSPAFLDFFYSSDASICSTMIKLNCLLNIFS